VAVLDSGVIDHEELNVTRVDYTDGPTDTTDYVGHGTHVAGIIGAKLNNSAGGAGVAPGVTIRSYRIGDETNGILYSYVIAALEQVATGNDGSREADMVNMSIGLKRYSSELEEAINDAYEAGVTLLASMGNDSTNYYQYPAGFDHVIAVAASDIEGLRSSYSDWGTWADIAAPGDSIYSTCYDSSTSYTYMSGTSMSTPVVTGACALYMSICGYTSPDDMEAVLKKSVSKTSSSQVGAGVLDLTKMFSVDTTAPGITVYSSGASTEITSFKSAIPYASSIELTDESAYGNGTLIFSINGKNPTISDGEVVNGYEYSDYVSEDGRLYVSTLIEELGLNVQKKITIKAATVSNTGVLSKVSSLSFISDYKAPTSITLSTPATLSILAGKSIQLSASVLPATAYQKVAWEISSDGTGKATINSAGKLTTKSGLDGAVVVKCYSTVDETIYDTVTVNVSSTHEITKKITLSSSSEAFNKNKLKLTYTDSANYDSATIVATATAASGTELEDVNYQWTSSNSKVAVGSSSGLITAVGKGTAKITVKALDGSNKTAVCNVTVTQMVTGLTISGQSIVAIGGSGKYKASASPSNANNKKVTWSLGSTYSGVTINAKSGALKVAKTASAGEATVVATAADGSGVTASFTVQIVASKASSVVIGIDSSETIVTDSISGPKYVTYNKKGVLTSVRLYTVDSYQSDIQENTIQLNSTVSNSTTPSWSSNNTKVATVDSNGLVTAVSSGKAVITCKAQDGSNKKATVTVNVIVPASDLNIKMNNNQSMLAFGKKATAKAVLGSTYGKASIQKAKWEIELAGIYEDSDGNEAYDQSDNEYLESLIESNYLKINESSGKITLNKKIKSDSNYSSYLSSTVTVDDNSYSIEGLVAIITATATDGTGETDTYYLYIGEGTTGYKWYYSSNSSYPLSVLSAYYKLYPLSAGDGSTYTYITISGGAQLDTPIVSSSSPKVASVKVYNTTSSLKVIYIYPLSKGTSTITIKSNDGTGKKASFKVTVK
ncbi:MAG: S8 family serine peptidase, partial [Butyrivibrio sp.]|nr:S8 family serine peptidase [Butyrivibrio sp.]